MRQNVSFFNPPHVQHDAGPDGERSTRAQHERAFQPSTFDFADEDSSPEIFLLRRPALDQLLVDLGNTVAPVIDPNTGEVTQLLDWAPPSDERPTLPRWGRVQS